MSRPRVKQINERISVSEQKDATVIVIEGKAETNKRFIAGLWAFLWTICGVYVFTQLFGEYDRDTKLAFFIYLFFWLYFEYKTMYAFLWNWKGFELIRLYDEKLSIKLDVLGFGKVRHYFLDNIRDMQLAAENPPSWLNMLEGGYFNLPKDTVTFEYMGKKVMLGKGLNRAQSQQLLNVLRHKVKGN